MAMGTSRKGFDLMGRGHLTKSAQSVFEHPSKNGKVNPNLVWDERSEREMNAAVPGGAFHPTGPQDTYEDTNEVIMLPEIEIKKVEEKKPWKPKTASDAYDTSMEVVKKPWKPSA